ncbi:hypothetical protein [Flavilitoribacter nigricans]|uniref:Uncharacterized protein n=1 Tax=Flavilitoribacter nigricans (strain ATCC 23147 / DSM 23189 / NBRC 102662 / NCIMB 1420 / SS-2) TaxID=1122177 RepID=A0A2D0MWY4_FLAN2|nr:hypothetical protein [Flavilitoribacter nigricans]PHN00755.1 hypothetical protein CRP01_40560 [Flavilitoribacter nigricans DSM 23189 = NBRC 102662]
MHKLYGTYLLYLVEEILKKADDSLSIKEIAARIIRLESSREQYNLEERVRRALSCLEDDGKLLKQMHRIYPNIHSYKYKLNQYEQKTEFS